MEFDLISTGMKTMAMLFFVLALLVGVLFVLKRFSFNRRDVKGNITMTVLSSLSLSPKDKIEVVDVQGERILLSISPSGVNFLTKINADSETSESSS